MAAKPERKGDDSLRAATLSRENPWPGLNRFDEQDAEFFYAREAQADEVRRRVHRERLTVLYGVSGLGKSSLLLAGLFPRIRSDNLLPVYVHLAHDSELIPLRDQVLQRIAREAGDHGIEAPATDPNASLWEHFHRRGNDYWTADNRPVTPLLVFDQFEEAFTIGRPGGEFAPRTAAFLAELGDLIEGRPPSELEPKFAKRELDTGSFDFHRHPYKVLIALREDFLADLNALGESNTRISIPSIMLNQMRLTPLSGAAALQVTQAGGPELVRAEVGEQIVRFVAGERAGDRRKELSSLTVDPALLSLFCSELNELRKTRPGAHRTITPNLLEGSQEEILANYYERCFEGVNPALRRFVEKELITDTDPPYRDFAALQVALSQPGVTRQGIDALIRQRLIRLEERGGTPRIELTHDVLTKVVKESRDRRVLEEERQAELNRLAAEKEKLRVERDAEERRLAEETRRLEKDRRQVRGWSAIALALLVIAIAGLGAATKKTSDANTAEAKAELAERSSIAATRAARSQKVIADAATARAVRDSIRALAMSDTAQIREASAARANEEALAQGALARLEAARATVTVEAAREARAAGREGAELANIATRRFKEDFDKLLTDASALGARLDREKAKLDSLTSVICAASTEEGKRMRQALEGAFLALSKPDTISLCPRGL